MCETFEGFFFQEDESKMECLTRLSNLPLLTSLLNKQ